MATIDFSEYASPEADKLLIVRFYHDAVENKFKSHEEGRPVFDDIEMCEINLPGDRARSLLTPAHSEWKRFGRKVVTYAERFKEHYARFKANEGPVVEGTPISEAPFLTMADKASLKALQVYTVEQLASLTGQSLKNIGAGGLAKQQQAVAYLATASGTADTVRMKLAIDERDAEIARLTAQLAGTQPGYESMTDEQLKEHIKTRTGARPKGNPSTATLVAMAHELDREPAVAA